MTGDADRLGADLSALLAVLADSGVPLAQEELLDALWLARRLPTGAGDAPLPRFLARPPVPAVPEAPADEDLAEGDVAFADGGGADRLHPDRVSVADDPDRENPAGGAPAGRDPLDSGPAGEGPTDADGDYLLSPPPSRALPGPPPPPAEGRVAGLHAAPARDHPTDRSADHRAPDPPGALALRVPEGKALRAELRIGRALRPLKQHRPSVSKRELDVEATVTALAETGLPDVALRPARERWLDLALVIDDGMSMLLWQRLATEIRAMMERLGAFRLVRTYGLHSQGPAARPRLSVRPFDPSSATMPSRVLADPSGQTLVLVLSDGMGPAWRDGRKHAAVRRWARYGPTAVLHALPRRMWDGSGIRAQRWQVTTRRSGGPNTEWAVSDPVLPADLAPFDGVPVPVLEPEPGSMTAWARLVASPGGSALMPLLSRPEPAREGGAPPADGLGAVQRFRDAASPEAYRLAAHLAAVAPVSVPVMRLVQAAVPWQADTAHLAEVFLGGLLRPVTAGPWAEEPLPRHRVFDFAETARDALLDAVPTAELMVTGRRVGQKLGQLAGRSPDFPAWLAHPSGPDSLPAGVRAFAEVGPRLAARFGAPALPPARPGPPSAPSAPVGFPVRPTAPGSPGHMRAAGLPDPLAPSELPDAPAPSDLPEYLAAAEPAEYPTSAEPQEYPAPSEAPEAFTAPPQTAAAPLWQQGPQGRRLVCPHCETPLLQGDPYCESCGMNVASLTRITERGRARYCPNCGAAAEFHDRYCGRCGRLLPEPETAVPLPTAPPAPESGAATPTERGNPPEEGVVIGDLPYGITIRHDNPRTFGPYKVVGSLAEDADSAAYLAVDQGSDRDRIAVVRAVRGDLPSARAARRLRTVAEALRRMGGLYAPRLYLDRSEDDRPWLAEQFVRVSERSPALRLTTVLSQMRGGADHDHEAHRAVVLGWHLAEAVASCTAEGITHGRLTADRVLVVGDTVKLVGWGDAAIADWPGAPPVSERPPLGDDILALGRILMALGGGEETAADPWAGSRWEGRGRAPLRAVVMACLSRELTGPAAARQVADAFASTADGPMSPPAWSAPRPPAPRAEPQAPTYGPSAPSPSYGPQPSAAGPPAFPSATPDATPPGRPGADPEVITPAEPGGDPPAGPGVDRPAEPPADPGTDPPADPGATPPAEPPTGPDAIPPAGPDAGGSTTPAAPVTGAPLEDTVTIELSSDRLPRNTPESRRSPTSTTRRRESAMVRAQALPGHRIAVISRPVAAGRSTTTLALGALLAGERLGKVIAVDAIPGGDALSRRVPGRTAATIHDLANSAGALDDYPSIRRFTTRTPSGLEVLVGNSGPVDPATSAIPIDDAGYRRVIAGLSRHYSIILADSDTGALPDIMPGVLGLADQLIVVTAPSVERMRSAHTTLDRLVQDGHAELVRRAIVVINMPYPANEAEVPTDLPAGYRNRCRGVVVVPHDEYLATGGEVDPAMMRTRTREAFVTLASLVAEDFPSAGG
ncbi:SAV_2336 N-terminal domain-related protein [Streptomyces luomodiensis]|uniref:SAV_2336 N-terminal domain-related protein n=1 Tax=Streptomyces luomodiensis TaxID=3026192 RepID=A0ABY9V6M2_9ACTN|nr:SAV_2336 N-terminal domain-related protein [Streptomyces sp. SCA4-21]WNE99554.1 SAV_2336 N-terminal domain-related protein [Streptomyces sp. SCA4-21]